MKKLCAILLIFAFLFAGCADNVATDLFAVPEMSEMHSALLDTVDSVRAEGFDFAEPRSGFNRQSLQIMDIDGDGEEEGIAFLRDISDTKKTYIYVFENSDSAFSLFDIIESSEKEIYTVSYSSLLGNSGYEIIVEWGQTGDGDHPITAYNLTEDGIKKVFDISAKQYSVNDFDGDGQNELIAVINQGTSFFADIYKSENGKILKQAQVALSKGGERVLRIISGNAVPHKKGAFIERKCEDGIITDVIVMSDGEYVNLLPNGEICSVQATCADVNADGVIEIPKETEREDAAASTDRTYLWETVSDDGVLIPRVFTYHSFSDNWYASMPLVWASTVFTEKKLTRTGETEIRFVTREETAVDEESYIEAHLFSIYVLTGSLRETLAAKEGRFIVSKRDDVIFAAEIASQGYLGTQITEDFIKSAFKNRESEWTSEILFA